MIHMSQLLAMNLYIGTTRALISQIILVYLQQHVVYQMVVVKNPMCGIVFRKREDGVNHQKM